MFRIKKINPSRLDSLEETVKQLDREVQRLKILPKLERLLDEYRSLGGTEDYKICSRTPQFYYSSHYYQNLRYSAEDMQQMINELKVKIADKHLAECKQPKPKNKETK